MPQFAYTGFRQNGEAVSGLLDAISEQAALEQLGIDGITPIDFGASSEGGVSRGKLDLSFLTRFTRRVPLPARTLFMRELATFVHADVPLLEALDVLQKQELNPTLKSVLSDVHHRVHGGEYFSQALAAHPKVFTPLHVNMVRVGETGGMLASVLEQVATWMEHEEELRGEIRGALTYPIMIVLMGLSTVVILFGFVLPRIASVFEGQASLPWITRVMMGISDLVRHWWHVCIAGGGLIAFFMWRAIQTERGKAIWDRAVLALPLVGTMIRKAAIARWARASAALLSGGVPLLETLNVVRGLLNNSSMIAMIEHALQRVTHGQSLARSVDEHSLLPPAVIHLLSVGERTGRLGEMFERVAQMAERQLRNQIRVVLNLLPPILIMGLAIMVAMIAMAVILPIYRLNSMMR